jgi:endoglucanase
LVFTADEFADGGTFIANTLQKQQIHGSFFLTGNFYKNTAFKKIIRQLKANGNYLGVHSDKHLLYCAWDKRDSLLVSKEEFKDDLLKAYSRLQKFGISTAAARYFLPPFEWYNDSISAWTKEMGLQLINFSPGTRSNADYTYPEMGNKYVSSEVIFSSILDKEKKSKSGLNGFILLSHLGTDARRTDKFYHYLPQLIKELKKRGYTFVKINELLD